MMDFLIPFYPWVKAFHIMAVIAWMAGLFYLPRLYVYHTEQVTAGSQTATLFETMELKLLRVIMNPAMMATWGFGLLLILTPGVIDWRGDGWFHAKLLGVTAMTVFHMWLARQRKRLAAGGNTVSGRGYRLMNEVPTLLMVLIVVMVVVKPF
ncbi:MAG: protoporphyrinogen oxidase HemJ [Pseudomonadota bacterium]